MPEPVELSTEDPDLFHLVCHLDREHFPSQNPFFIEEYFVSSSVDVMKVALPTKPNFAVRAIGKNNEVSMSPAKVF